MLFRRLLELFGGSNSFGQFGQSVVSANSVGYCKCYVDNGTSVAVQVGLVSCLHYLAKCSCKASIMVNAVAVVPFCFQICSLLDAVSTKANFCFEIDFCPTILQCIVSSNYFFFIQSSAFSLHYIPITSLYIGSIF